MTPGLETTHALEHEIIQCTGCPRLRRHCVQVAQIKRKAYSAETYWGKPVPPFGDPRARILVVGLAPGAHGANRTGRIFTGDRSGDWLYRSLFRAGLANQPTSTAIDDGLRLKGARVTCVVKCAPPDNKPSPAEVRRCSQRFLARELATHPEVRVFIALGKLAWDSLLRELDPESGRPTFKHGARHPLSGGRWLVASYHPSQQNTFTGKLTEPMFDGIFKSAVALC